uniref:Uncharacterized protein n=1 Tax=Nelumbo nucifera TaxID=4432 RepID=A0A822YPF4_NELNU|nr:TPA_asm: hypothetical protein HUJ06_012312 [Nelumbo nucifera]
MSSGFGGLGFEGMVGRDDSAGEALAPPGVGNNGVMSGDKTGGEAEMGGFGKNAGAAEMAEACNFSSGERDNEGETMKATMSTKVSKKEAIE